MAPVILYWRASARAARTTRLSGRRLPSLSVVMEESLAMWPTGTRQSEPWLAKLPAKGSQVTERGHTDLVLKSPRENLLSESAIRRPTFPLLTSRANRSALKTFWAGTLSYFSGIQHARFAELWGKTSRDGKRDRQKGPRDLYSSLQGTRRKSKKRAGPSSLDFWSIRIQMSGSFLALTRFRQRF